MIAARIAKITSTTISSTKVKPLSLFIAFVFIMSIPPMKPYFPNKKPIKEKYTHFYHNFIGIYCKFIYPVSSQHLQTFSRLVRLPEEKRNSTGTCMASMTVPILNICTLPSILGKVSSIISASSFASS